MMTRRAWRLVAIIFRDFIGMLRIKGIFRDIPPRKLLLRFGRCHEHAEGGLERRLL
jgi:hypothetical protein